MGEQVTVKGRLLNNAIFSPKTEEYDGQSKSAYSALVVLEDGEAAKLEKARDRAVKEKWGDKPPAKMMDYVVREGDDPEFENTFGKMFINAKSVKNAPKALKKMSDGSFEKTYEDDDPQLIYAGVFVYASVDIYCYDANKQKRSPPGCTVGLRGVLHWKHGESLSGAVIDTDKEFGDVDVEEQDDGYEAE